MDKKGKQVIKIDYSKHLQFLNEARVKDGIYLYKGTKYTDYAMNEIKKHDQQDIISIGVVGSNDEEIIIDIVNSLLDEYEWVVLIKNNNNFSEKEDENIGLAVEKVFYTAHEYHPEILVRPNVFSELSNKLKNSHRYFIGRKYLFYADCFDEENEAIITYKNRFIKLSKVKSGNGKNYFTVLTNYSFKITEIIINADNENTQELIIELTDFENIVRQVKISAKDKHSIANFRKIIYPLGNFLDGMSDADFKQILNQLYTDKEYKVVYQRNRPGLVHDENVWLYADDVINLEN